MCELYLCPTPIGNLEDITLRTLKVLNEVDYICAEDTRHSIKLLNHFNIKKPLISYHEHNKYKKLNYIIERLLEGSSVALISDAGTPAISDPGYELVKECIKTGIRVVPLPGATALITALISSGIENRRFIFEGFLPADKKEREEVLKSNKNEVRTMIFYEAPHRLKKTLKIFYENFGQRDICVARELTKIYEDIKYFKLSDAIDYYNNQIDIKGEFVIVIAGKSLQEIEEDRQNILSNISIKDHVIKYINKGYTEKEAMKIVAKERNTSKRDIYALIKGDKDE